MCKIKKTKFAGSFYPSDAGSLAKMIKSMENESEKDIKIDKPACVILPHAGYVYSGQCAVDCLKQMKSYHYNRVVVIAPSHRVGGFDFSIGAFDEFETPDGNIKTDLTTINKLLEFDLCRFIPQTFEYEHSLEVQLPLLKYFLGEFQLIPIVISNQHALNSKKLGELLFNTIDDIDNTLFVASTDLSHFHSAESAEIKDNTFIDLIKKMDIGTMQNKLASRDTEACGFGTVMTILNLAKALETEKPKIITYTHSGKVSGDNMEVVGYVSALFEHSGG